MKRVMLLAAFFVLQLPFVKAQPGAIDLTFNPGGAGVVNTSGYNVINGGGVNAICVGPDDKIIVGGAFTKYNGTDVFCIARLNANGSLDTTFKPGSNCNTLNGVAVGLYTIGLQSDGKVVMGGIFNCYNGVGGNFIARANTDGSADTSFHTGTGFNNQVYSLAIQSDGKILVGGIFTSFNGATQNSIARLNNDGTVDTSFHSGTGANGSVQAIAIQQDGKILIGGDFSNYNGTLEIRLARLNSDGTIDSSFNPIYAGNKAISSIVSQPGTNSILVGGAFGSYQGTPCNMVARVEMNGNRDSQFDVTGGPAPEGTEVHCLLVDNNNEVLVGGQFPTIDGDNINNLVLLNNSGNVDYSFRTYPGPDGGVGAMAFQSNGKIIIAGGFTNYQNVAVGYIARLNTCLLPSPNAIYGDSTTLCGGTMPYSINRVDSATSYAWTLPTGWTGGSDSTSIVATSNGVGGVVSVSAYNDLCGFSIPKTDTIVQIEAPEVPICLVTVDSQSTHNIIVWKKPHTSLIDSFYIYRQITTNVYSKIAAVPFVGPAQYEDYGADPNVTSYSYKISVLDTCGVESPLSLYQNTIHLQSLGDGNFQWTLYQIENSPNPVISYNIYKDAEGNGNFVDIGLVPGNNTTFTDVNYAAFPNARYLVDVNWAIYCGDITATNTTRSNIRPGGTPSGANTPELANSFELYPNPAEKIVTVRFAPGIIAQGLKIFNALGQLVYEKANEPGSVNASFYELNLGHLVSGVYTVVLETTDQRLLKRLVIR